MDLYITWMVGDPWSTLFPSFLGAMREQRKRVGGRSKRSYNFKSSLRDSTLGLVGRFGSPLQLQIRFPTVSVKTHTTYN